jgi:hypothetical protein
MFDEEIKVLDVPASSISAEKDEDLWYSNSEYFLIRRQATNMAKRMEDCDDEKDCSRGLEIVENNAVKERNKRIQDKTQILKSLPKFRERYPKIPDGNHWKMQSTMPNTQSNTFQILERVGVETITRRLGLCDSFPEKRNEENGGGIILCASLHVNPNRYSSCWRAFITEPWTKLRTVMVYSKLRLSGTTMLLCRDCRNHLTNMLSLLLSLPETA